MEGGRSVLTDAELVATVVSGDATAFAELYDRYSGPVFRAAYRRLGDRHLAEEVLQDTYLALWNRAQLFDPAAGSLLAWLSTIARNRAVDRLRALGRRPNPVPLSSVAPPDGYDDRSLERTIAQAELLASAPLHGDPEQVVDEAALRGEVLAALDGMPSVERTVIHMAYYEELTQSEIAERLGWPLGTVKTRTRRALARLRDVLGEQLAPEMGRSTPRPVAVDIAVERSASRGVGDGSH